MTRQTNARNLRVAAADAQANVFYGTQQTNGDEGLYADYRGSFTKSLPHNDLGDVDTSAYQGLLDALDSGQSADFEAIRLGGDRRLANPQAAYRYAVSGLDSHKTFIRPAPTFAGAEAAAEMGELYWKALCRDIPFAEFETNVLIGQAVSDLNAFSQTVGALDNGVLTRNTIFRGETPGDLTGPYISQFLLQDVPYGNTTLVQRYRSPTPGNDQMTDLSSWLAAQRGFSVPRSSLGNARYINDARVLAEYVHTDYSFQAYNSAALILLNIPGSFDVGNLYNTSVTQGGFSSLGGPDVLDLVSKAANLALSGAWYQKWLVHRRLRPENYGGKLHQQIAGAKDYGLPDEIVNSEGPSRVRTTTGTFFLPQAFPEGSPTHPSYPAGHATIAGACATILKAFFEESMPYPNPVVASANGAQLLPYNGGLTIGGEINKLANNIALGRDWAGVHYRSDGVDGLAVGEQQAIGLLEDYSRTYNEQFDGFTLTKFDGTTINIRNGAIV